jgi:LCP family protein required for cell wall assembly
MQKYNNNGYANNENPPDNGGGNSKKPWSVKKKIIVFSLLAVLAAGLVYGGIFAYKVFINPSAAFDVAGNNIEAEESETAAPSPSETVTPTPSETPSASETVTPTPTPSIDPYEQLNNVANTGDWKDIVTVVLYGIDYAPERTSGSYKRQNKHFYTDVVMVMAVNFKKNKVDLISIPRDSWTEMPNKKGIYRIKEAFYFGGGIDKPEKGLDYSVKAVSWQLGGLPINGYIAVTMPVVKELVDIFGGVDYNVEQTIKINGRTLKKGQQHLNGQQALDYFRARKSENVSGGTGDINRVNRQKDLLVAIFKKLKTTQMLSKIPEILKSMEGKLFTNLSFEQLAALAVFGSKLDEDSNIKLHTFEGNLASMFNWSFCFPNQDNRVDIIKEVYGKTVKKHNDYTYSAGQNLWYSMQAKVWVSRVKAVLKKDDALVPPKLLPEERTELQTLLDATTAALSSDNTSDIKKSKDALKKRATALFKTYKYKISWSVDENATS